MSLQLALRDIMRVIKIVGIIWILITSIGFSYLFFQTPKVDKVGYVHNDKMLNGFVGYKERQAEYHAMVKLMQSDLDSLSRSFNFDVEKYTNIKSTLSAKERENEEIKLGQIERQVIQFKKDIEAKASQKEYDMNQEIVNEINSLVEEYSKEYGYDALIGVTENGNVLYAKPSKDITEEVVSYINKKYEGE